jgi:O-antigen/teichoic acid export membrane protein
MKDLKEKTIRGGLARIIAQGVNFAFRLGSLMVLARLLGPRDFGLVGMVTAFTGVLGLFRDFGLSTASVQRAHVTEEQISTLFWINALVGVLLAVLVSALAPVIASFYHEPRLVWVAVVLATGFLFNAAGVQHSAILQRELRFTALAVISTVALVVSTVVAICLAELGYGYWALVAMTVALPLINTIGCWITTKWIPGAPRRRVGIRSMMRFGGTITLNGLVVYVAYNLEKVLLGRFWGADAIGIYGRAYQLINIPTDNMNSAVGEVAFSALSRVQDDPSRLRSYFLKGYSLVIGVTLPITLACALFSNDLIFVLLGPKWTGAAAIFRLLAPTILIFAMINPLGWLLLSLGLVGRSLKIALVIAPLVITGYVAGLPYGVKGVALGYSLAMTLWVIPHIVWCVHGTGVSVRDIGLTVSRPLLSGVVAALLAFGVQMFYGQSLRPIARLALGGTVLFCAYLATLLYVMGQKALYLDLIRGFRRRSVVTDEVLASV